METPIHFSRDVRFSEGDKFRRVNLDRNTSIDLSLGFIAT